MYILQSEGDTMMKRATIVESPPWSENVTPEWLGAESHVPSLRRDLQRQVRANGQSSFRWAVFSIFVAGLAIGSMITWLSDPRRVRS